MELEFVQCLCNLHYLHCDPYPDLANSGYLEDPQFLRYLEYLSYWKEDPYVKYLMYPFLSFPQALHFLTLLQNVEFRRRCKDWGFITFMHQSQFQHWSYRGRPEALVQALSEQTSSLRPSD